MTGVDSSSTSFTSQHAEARLQTGCAFGVVTPPGTRGILASVMNAVQITGHHVTIQITPTSTTLRVLGWGGVAAWIAFAAIGSPILLLAAAAVTIASTAAAAATLLTDDDWTGTAADKIATAFAAAWIDAYPTRRGWRRIVLHTRRVSAARLLRRNTADTLMRVQELTAFL
jgi:hypothetical protein